jgi:hypothetical protein
LFRSARADPPPGWPEPPFGHLDRLPARAQEIGQKAFSEHRKGVFLFAYFLFAHRKEKVGRSHRRCDRNNQASIETASALRPSVATRRVSPSPPVAGS